MMELCSWSRRRAVISATVQAGITHGLFNPLCSIQGPLNALSCPFSAKSPHQWPLNKERDEFSLNSTKNWGITFFTSQKKNISQLEYVHMLFHCNTLHIYAFAVRGLETRDDGLRVLDFPSCSSIVWVHFFVGLFYWFKVVWSVWKQRPAGWPEGSYKVL